MLALIFLLVIVTLFQPSAEVTYSCNSNAACGCSTSPASVTRIVGGEAASVNTWGWAVSLSINDSWLCGGTILSSSWIMTAAHCVTQMLPSEVLVSAATNRLYGFTQRRYAVAVIVHPRYNSRFIVNDIALVEVSPAFNMTDPGIAKICLPIATTDDYPPINSTVCQLFCYYDMFLIVLLFVFNFKLVAIGWGLLRSNGSVSKTLQQVTLQRVSYDSDTCHPLISNKLVQFCGGDANGGKGNYMKKTRSVRVLNPICFFSKGTCFGDSGSALMMYTSSRQWVVVGITSYGYESECGIAEYADVFTRVVYYLDWIRSMNVTDAVTIDSVTTTMTTLYFPMNMTMLLTNNGSNSTNDDVSCYRCVHILFLGALIMFPYTFITL